MEEKKMKSTSFEDDDKNSSTGTNEVLIFKIYLRNFFHEIFLS